MSKIVVCPDCGVKFSTYSVSGYGWRPQFKRHTERCKRATPEERLYFAKHRRWPRKQRRKI